ncbi:MAG: sugar phosphate isomerase/epimerase [Victivallaceae bacterium]|nr:sugar phosphate isomerase/epimerase [Victivallaceae bacterium]
MFLTGFADEAGKDIDCQIKATLELGWENIELRLIGDKTLATVSEAEFETLYEKLAEAGIRINCFGSGIANWSKSPCSQEDFDASVKELADAIPRLQRLGTRLVRGMSFKILDDRRFDSPELEKIIFKKVNILTRMCEDAGIIYGHENCMNYGGQSYVHTLRLLENIKSDHFKLIFDTGNPVFSFRRLGTEPYPLQNSFEFYRNVREYIYYVHIKDGIAVEMQEGYNRPVTRFTFAGEGSGFVRQIVTDLREYGYDGGFSIEPHLATVFHEGDDPGNSDLAARRKYETYVKYGRRFEQLLKDCGWKIPRKCTCNSQQRKRSCEPNLGVPVG